MNEGRCRENFEHTDCDIGMVGGKEKEEKRKERRSAESATESATQRREATIKRGIKPLGVETIYPFFPAELTYFGKPKTLTTAVLKEILFAPCVMI